MVPRGSFGGNQNSYKGGKEMEKLICPECGGDISHIPFKELIACDDGLFRHPMCIEILKEQEEMEQYDTIVPKHYAT